MNLRNRDPGVNSSIYAEVVRLFKGAGCALGTAGLLLLPCVGAAGRSTLTQAVTHIEPGKDPFLTELYNEEIHGRLAALKKVLASELPEAELLAAMVADDFRGTPLTPARRQWLREGVVQIARYEPETALQVTAQSLPGQIATWLGELTKVHRIELKTTSIALESAEPPQVRVDIRYDITGQTAAGERRQLTGTWETRWRRNPEQEWLLAELTLREGWESAGAGSYFTDITARALARQPGYEQSLRGIDWYSAHLDAALGMTVYGLQGVAVADVNGDGREDIFVCQPDGLPNRLFLSKEDGTYTDFSAEAGVDALERCSGAIFSDLDNDGDLDLLVASRWWLMLFRNNGGEGFTFVSPVTAGLSPPTKTITSFQSLCVADYDRDGWLDIYVTSYSWSVSKFPNPVPYYDARNGPPNFLFRNNADGSFADVTAEARLGRNNDRFSFACSWADYDRDGWPDLYVANDFGRNNLYRNNGDGTFTDMAAELGVEDIGSGMSVAWGDYDNDGRFDVYVGNMWSSAGLRTTTQPVFQREAQPSTKALYRRMAKGNTLFRNCGQACFEETTEQAGVALGRWAWSSQFFDLDLDGHEDLYVVNGYITNEDTHDL